MKKPLVRAVGLLLVAVAALVTTAWADPLRDHGWQLHERNWDTIRATIERAPEFGVTEIRLSHDIIRCIDQINEEPEVGQIVNDTCELAGRHGMKVYVWAKELNIGEDQLDQDLDPDGGGKAMWDARRDAYRQAFTRCPGLYGIVLQFGSCPTEVWEVRDSASAFNARTPDDERVAMTIEIVKAVCDQYGKKVDVRTFNHSPQQLEAVRAGIAKVPGVRAMIKEVPQDWQPYYPLNPVIGKVGPNESFIEMDLGAEYWGLNEILFCMTDYLAWRFRNMVPRGIVGVVARVECGSNRTLGTPNEINLYALARLIKDPSVSPDTISRDWVKQRYGVDPGREEARRLISALRHSFDTGRKMYYVLTAWALEKSSDIPSAVCADCLIPKNTAQWDPDFADWYHELRDPTPATLARIWQEKEEAIELAQRSLDDLEAARPSLKSDDYADLHRRMTYQRQCALVWKYVADAVFRSQVYQETEKERDRQILEGDLQALEALAREMSPDSPLANPQRIRSFAAHLKAKLPGRCEAAKPEVNVLSAIRAEDVAAATTTLCWTSQEPAIGWVEWGTKLPNFDLRSPPESEATVSHRMGLTGLEPATRYVFRIAIAGNASGDYTFTTPARAAP